MMKTKTKPELSDYQVIKINGKGRLIYKNLPVELTGIFQPESWRGMDLLNSLIFTYDDKR